MNKYLHYTVIFKKMSYYKKKKITLQKIKLSLSTHKIFIGFLIQSGYTDCNCNDWTSDLKLYTWSLYSS